MNKKERFIIVVILTLVALMVAMDIVTDTKEGVATWHVLVEGATGLAALFGIFYFRGAYRRALLFAFGSMIFTTTVVAIIKYQSNVACPWDMAEYGGDVVAGAGGGCWPSGHASTGYCLFALFFAARWLGKDHAGWIFAGVLMLGTLLSVSQTVRGAHFLSHGMWTGVIIWTLNCLMARIWLPVSADDPQAMGIVCQPAAAKVAADYS